MKSVSRVGLTVLAVLLCIAIRADAADSDRSSVNVSFGYSFLKFVGEDGDTFPLGGYVALGAKYVDFQAVVSHSGGGDFTSSSTLLWGGIGPRLSRTPSGGGPIVFGRVLVGGGYNFDNEQTAFIVTPGFGIEQRSRRVGFRATLEAPISKDSINTDVALQISLGIVF